MEFYKKLSLVISLLLLVSVSFAQMAVVSYMRLEGSTDDYLEVEKKWKKMHEVRINNGNLVGWQLFEVMFAGQESPAHYIVVNHYKDMDQYEKAFEGGIEALYQAAYPEGNWDELSKATGDSRVLTHNEVYWLQDEATSEKETKYLTVNYFKVREGGGQEYVDMEKELYKPWHQESMKTSDRSYWGVYSMRPRPHNKYQYVTVDGYTGEDVEGYDAQAVWKTVHPDKDWDETWQKIAGTRETAKSVRYELVDSVWKEEQQQ